jgi:hypothetical protein
MQLNTCEKWGSFKRAHLFTNKEVTNTGIAEAILKFYGMDIGFIYMKYDVDLHHVVPKTFQIYVRKCVRMT